jgi:hypothetical protein
MVNWAAVGLLVLPTGEMRLAFQTALRLDFPPERPQSFAMSIVRSLSIIAALAILADCESRSPPPSLPLLPTPPIPSAAIPTADCNCGDRDDIKLRLAAAEAALQQAQEEATHVPPDKLYDEASRTRFGVALNAAMNDAMSNTYLPDRPTIFTNPFKSAHTNEESCQIDEIPPMSRCMSADAMMHEQVHERACRERPKPPPFFDTTGFDKGIPIPNPPKLIPLLIEFMQEEITAYSAEVAFLHQQLKRLEDNCRGYRFDGSFTLHGHGRWFGHYHMLTTCCGFSARPGSPARCWNYRILALTPDSEHAPLFGGRKWRNVRAGGRFRRN